MITIPVADVRDILGVWSNGIKDAEIASTTVATMVQNDISGACPSWVSISDPDELALLNTAIAYLAASRLLANVIGTKSMTLGDQAISFNAAAIADERARWRQEAFSIIGNICPIQAGSSMLGVQFTKACGRRG